MWDFSSQTRDGTYILCIGRQILNHWTVVEVPPVGELSLTTHFMFDKLKNNHIVIDLDRLVVNRKLRCIMKEEKQPCDGKHYLASSQRASRLNSPKFPSLSVLG